MAKRAFVFIDGSNFYFKLKELTSKLNRKFSLMDFNFRKFGEWLVKPAVEEVKAFGKTIQYVITPKGQSFGLSRVADDVRLLRPEEIEQFLPQSLI